MLTRTLVVLALFVALVLSQDGEFVLRRAPNPTPSTTKDDYFSAAVLEGDALGGKRTPEPTKKDDYYWNAAVEKQNEDKPVAVVATTIAPVATDAPVTVAPVAVAAAPLTQQQLVEKLRIAREKINSESVVKRQQIVVAQQKFVDAKDSCKKMVGKYKSIANKIRENVKKAQKSGNTLAVSRGKKAISNLKGRFKRDVRKCKQKVQEAKNTLMYRPFASDNEKDQNMTINLEKLRQVAQKQIKIEQEKVKKARKEHTKKFNKDFKKAADAAKNGKKTKLVNFVKKARRDAKKEIHQVLQYTQEATKNTDVFTAKKMFIKARKHVDSIKKNYRSMKSKAKKALLQGKNKKTHKKSDFKSKRVIAKKAQHTIVLALKTGDKDLLEKGRRLARKIAKRHGKKTHKKSVFKSKSVIVKNNLVAKKAQHTIVLALKTGDKDLLEKGRRLARKARKVVKKHGKKTHKKSSGTKTLAKKAKLAQRKYKKMLKSGRTKCRSKKAFGKFKIALKRARNNAKKLNAKVKKTNKKHAKKTKKHAKSQKARKCPK